MCEKINKEKFDKIISFIKHIHKKYLFKYLVRDFESKIQIFLTVAGGYIQKPEEIKEYLYYVVERLKKEYQKILDLSNAKVPDIYAKIYELINSEFDCFPQDLDEYNFKKLMQKTFNENKMNSIPAEYSGFYKNKNINKKMYK